MKQARCIISITIEVAGQEVVVRDVAVMALINAEEAKEIGRISCG